MVPDRVLQRRRGTLYPGGGALFCQCGPLNCRGGYSSGAAVCGAALQPRLLGCEPRPLRREPPYRGAVRGSVSVSGGAGCLPGSGFARGAEISANALVVFWTSPDRVLPVEPGVVHLAALHQLQPVGCARDNAAGWIRTIPAVQE